MSPHHWRNFGCHSSSARWRRRSEASWTLFGMRAFRSTGMGSGPSPVEFGSLRPAVERERSALADGVGPLEDPVLPRGEPAEDLRLQRLRAGEAQARLHAGERVGREARALLDREAHLV